MYYAILEQDGGCDYTIGCGIKVRKLHAKTHDDAITEVKKMLVGTELEDWNDTEYSEDTVHRVTLMLVAKEEMLPLDIWRSETRERQSEIEALKKEESERETFERLQKKFGPKT